MKRKDFTPLIMWFCLLAGILVMASLRLCRTEGFWSGYAIHLDAVFIGNEFFTLEGGNHNDEDANR